MSHLNSRATLAFTLTRHCRNQTRWLRQPSHLNLSGMQQEMKAGTDFYFDQRWFHKPFLSSWLPERNSRFCLITTSAILCTDFTDQIL